MEDKSFPVLSPQLLDTSAPNQMQHGLAEVLRTALESTFWPKYLQRSGTAIAKVSIQIVSDEGYAAETQPFSFSFAVDLSERKNVR